MPRSLIRTIKSKRLIFTISTGRSGTGYLSKMLNYLPGVHSTHEPEPKFSHYMREIQHNAKLAREFWLREKMPAISASGDSIYIETSHLVCKGFLEPLLELGITPNVIILRRPFREVASSLYTLDTIPARSENGQKFLLSPEDPGVLSLPNWQKFNDYQLCYWYCLEIERRAVIYKNMLTHLGARVVETNLDEITTPYGFHSLCQTLNLPILSESAWKDYLTSYLQKINTKKEFKKNYPPFSPTNLDELETEVLEALSENGQNKNLVKEFINTDKELQSKKPVISTILLNWNRSDLLERTLSSYFSTVTSPYELFIIDNASTDSSREIIEQYSLKHPYVRPVFLPQNIGGEAFNIGIEYSQGKYIHLSENDLEYLPGWCEYIYEIFEAFPNLGQLSLFGPVPTDDEVWENKPSVLKHSKGKIIYEALGNVGTSSVLHSSLVDQDFRVQTLKSNGTFLFPDDGLLSQDVKSKGYMVAWADHYLVKNIGHMAIEFKNREEYYRENYRSKPWLGEEGWQKRKEKWQQYPKPKRDSFLISPKTPILPEKTDPQRECPYPQLWSMVDGWTAEVETLEFLYAFIRLVKPAIAVETGTWHGFTATAIGRAMQNNGFGKLTSLELDRESYEVAINNIAEEDLEPYVKVLHLHSLEYIPDEKIDFLLLDSELDTREIEFHHFAPYLNYNAYVIFHDVSEKHKIVREGINRLLALDNLHGFFIPSPRGLAVFQYQPRHESIDEVLERLQHRLSRADESVEALIAAFEDKENPVSDQEIEILNLNIAQARDDGDDVLAETLSKLVEIAYHSRREE